MKILLTLLLIISSITIKADQLAWLTLNEAKIATDFLNSENEIISWCACCTDDKMSLITIKNSYYKKIEGEENYYQVYINGKDDNGYEINQSFDLAYLHYKKNGMAVCLGTGLGFECDPCTPIFKWPFNNVNNAETSANNIDSDGFKYVTTAKDGSIYSVLVEKKGYSNTEIWVKNTIPVKNIKNNKGKLIKSGGGHFMTYMIVDCQDKEFTIEEKVIYNGKGDVIQSDKFGSYNNKIVPGSVMSAIFSDICLK